MIPTQADGLGEFPDVVAFALAYHWARGYFAAEPDLTGLEIGERLRRSNAEAMSYAYQSWRMFADQANQLREQLAEVSL